MTHTIDTNFQLILNPGWELCGLLFFYHVSIFVLERVFFHVHFRQLVFLKMRNRNNAEWFGSLTHSEKLLRQPKDTAGFQDKTRADKHFSNN